MTLHSDAELSRVPSGRLYAKPVPEIAAPNDPQAENAPNLSAPVTRTPVPSVEVGAPVDLLAIAPADMAAPNVLTPVPDPGIQLNHGRIGYVSYVQEASLSVSSGSDTVGAIRTPSTWERWQPSAGGAQTITALFPQGLSVGYVGLAGYDLDGASVLVETSTTDAGAFTLQGTIDDFSKESVMFLFGPVSIRRVRLTITRAEPVALGVFYCGPVLSLERGTRGGSTPAPLNRSTSYSNEFSAAGQILGRVINRQGIRTAVNLRNLTDAWYRANFDPFVAAARTQPFFYLWNPRDYPADCIYGVASDDIAPTLQGGRAMMDVSFEIEGV